MQLTLPMLATLPRTGPTDPIEYYRRPLVGWLFRERINRGLGLLPRRRYGRALEIGYAAGAVQLVLGASVDESHGIDLDTEPGPVRDFLASQGREAHLLQGSVYALPYSDGFFDLVVCFSVLEHLHDYPLALREIARVMAPGGLFLLGMPAVNRMMEAGFAAIGFGGIEHHHVTTPAQVRDGLSAVGLCVERTHHLDLPARAPLGVRLYYNWLIRSSGPPR
jgi:SAM-dependent methyltransferase